MSLNNYQHRLDYEAFLTRAYPTIHIALIKSALADMERLVADETGETWVSKLPSSQKQLDQVKRVIDMAFQKLIKCMDTMEKKTALSNWRHLAAESNQGSALLHIVHKAMEMLD